MEYSDEHRNLKIIVKIELFMTENRSWKVTTIAILTQADNEYLLRRNDNYKLVNNCLPDFSQEHDMEYSKT